MRRPLPILQTWLTRHSLAPGCISAGPVRPTGRRAGSTRMMDSGGPRRSSHVPESLGLVAPKTPHQLESSSCHDDGGWGAEPCSRGAGRGPRLLPQVIEGTGTPRVSPLKKASPGHSHRRGCWVMGCFRNQTGRKGVSGWPLSSLNCIFSSAKREWWPTPHRRVRRAAPGLHPGRHREQRTPGRWVQYLIDGAIRMAQYPVALALVPDPVTLVLISIPEGQTRRLLSGWEGPGGCVTHTGSSDWGSARTPGTKAKIGPEQMAQAVALPGPSQRGRWPWRPVACSDGSPACWAPGVKVWRGKREGSGGACKSQGQNFARKLPGV